MSNDKNEKNEKYTYRCILDTVPNPIFEVNRGLIITLANREAYKWWPEIIEGKSRSADILSHQKNKDEDTGIIEKTFEFKEPQITDIETKNGEFFNIKTNYVEEGDATRVIVHILDMTGRRWAEKALQQSKEQYRLFNHVQQDRHTTLWVYPGRNDRQTHDRTHAPLLGSLFP